jgi:hypothetical protein
MEDEISDITGPVPMVISEGEKLPTLINLLTSAYGNEMDDQNQLIGTAEQVIIVRNEQEKRNLPHELKRFPCFTVVESKGLEFEDVLLFNFFGSSEKYQCWNYVSKIKIETQSMSPEDYEKLQ